MRLLILVLIVLANAFATNSNPTIQSHLKEQRYEAVRAHFESNSNKVITFFSAEFADEVYQVLWDLNDEGKLKSKLVVNKNDLAKLNLLQKLKYFALNRADIVQTDADYLQREISLAINQRSMRDKEVTYLTSFRNYFPRELVLAAKESFPETVNSVLKIVNHDSSLSKEEIKEVFDFRVSLTSSYNQQYKDKLRIFVFCRRQRRYPCRLLIKDNNGELVTSNNKVFSIPVLAKASRDLPSNITNGQTPQGVHSVDGVMPQANRQRAFGKFRRVILSFLPGFNVNDENTKEFLPTSQHEKLWWKKASLARDVDRTSLRIHGTGNVSSDDRPYYPHVPTAGCISTREGTYNNVIYTDQRTLLDALMRANFLDVNYDNEMKIKGTLTLIELDNLKEPVRIEDLNFLF